MHPPVPFRNLGHVTPGETGCRYPSEMDGWQERLGRWELWSGWRVVAYVTPDAQGAEVVIDCRMAWQS
jgi:hypothetical protein